MWKVSVKEYPYVRRMLEEDMEHNIYVLGDIARYGLDSEKIECFAGGSLEHPEYVLMRFGKSYVLYSSALELDMKELGAYFCGKEVHCISGKNETIEKIGALFPGSHIIVNKMLKLSGRQYNLNECFENKTVLYTNKSLGMVQAFYCEIDEFCEKMEGEMGRRKLEEQFRNGKIYGLHYGGGPVAMAALSAETEKFAMVDDVAVAKRFRKQGFGYELLKSVCHREIVENGKEFLCVCCSDIGAENLYKKVGFVEISAYSMLYAG